MNNVKEMKYTVEKFGGVLADVTDESGYRVVVLNLGSHPTAYVGIPCGNPLAKSIDRKIGDIVCHGGITYCASRLKAVNEDKRYKWIGWDYCHYGNYGSFPDGIVIPGVKHTTEEMMNDAQGVIEQLKKLEGVTKQDER